LYALPGACTGLAWCGDNAGTCATVQKLQPDSSNAGSLEQFGTSVSLSGNLAVVGEPNTPSSIGAVFTYARQSSGTWTMQGGKLAPPAGNAGGFGTDVSLSGQRLLVGAPTDNTNGGAAYIFELVAGAWVQQTKLLGQANPYHFGQSVSLDGDRALVGASGISSAPQVGAAYIFDRNTDGSWPATGIRVQGWPAGTNDQFGICASLSGDRAIVGSNRRNVVIFAREPDGTWPPEQALTATGGQSTDQFGLAVSIAGDRALVGAAQDTDLGTAAGAVYVFERQANNTWMQTAKLHAPPPNAGANEQFGTSVAQSGDHVLVGAIGAVKGAGTAYVFVHNADGSWTTGAELQSSATDVVNTRAYGNDVSLSGDFALIGAFVDEAGPPIMGAPSCGTAYVADTRAVLP
jgi:FG-GAP repeat